MDNSSCNIQITTRRDGEEFVFAAKGRLRSEKNGLSFTYRQDEDDVHLRVWERGMVMERGTRLKMRFLPGKLTTATLFAGDSSGTFQVFTVGYSVVFEQHIQIFLSYELRFPKNVQQVSVKILIQRISEDS